MIKTKNNPDPLVLEELEEEATTAAAAIGLVDEASDFLTEILSI